METIFALSLAAVVWAYGGWLVALVLLEAFVSLRERMRFVADGERPDATRRTLPPKLSVLIAAHDEEAVIRQKLENTFAFDWPPQRLEILVGSDGSTDGTDEIVRSFADRGVVLSSEPRQGKSAVLNRLAKRAKGDLLLFTDANTMIAPDAPIRLAERFSDPFVGAVSGRLRLVTPRGGDVTEGAYWRYETLLKLYESRLGVLMGANGGLYMLRRELWRPLRPDTVVDDFVVSMRVLLDGRRLEYEPLAVAEEETAPDMDGEWTRRVRIAAGNFQSLRELWPLVVRPSLTGLAFVSHKLLRWLAPVAMVAALVSNAVLATGSVGWTLVFVGQLSFYAAAAFEKGRLGRLTRAFVTMNAAMLVGLLRWLRGTQAAAWQRTARRAA